MIAGGGCRSWDAAAIARELTLRRQEAPALGRAYEAALRIACGREVRGRAERRLRRAGLAVAAAVERSAAERAAAEGELAYHNRVHFVDATLAMGWLCGTARDMGRLDGWDAAVGVTAMVGHDLGHDGDSALDGRLEGWAAVAVADIAARAGVAAQDRAWLAEVIRATRPDLWQENAGRAAGWKRAGRGGAGLWLLRLLANEADAFASLMPGLGPTLGRALAAERAARGDPSAAMVDSHVGRLGFLTGYRRFSPAARRLGLAKARDRQVVAYARRGSGDAMRGARKLDGVAAGG